MRLATTLNIPNSPADQEIATIGMSLSSRKRSATLRPTFAARRRLRAKGTVEHNGHPDARAAQLQRQPQEQALLQQLATPTLEYREPSTLTASQNRAIDSPA
jgi:hypothetical protein